MKTIIAGGRNYQFASWDYGVLDQLHKDRPITEVVSGACPTGADYYGECWAGRNGVPVKRFRPDWTNLGLAAGPLRNKQMAEYADCLILFPGGSGTASMRNEAKRYGIPIYEPYAT